MFDSPDTARLIAFAIAIVVAWLMGIVLFHFSQQTHQAKARLIKSNTSVSAEEGKNGPVISNVLSGIEGLRIPAAKQQEVAAALSDMLNRHVESQTAVIKEELLRAEEVAKEKTQEATILRKKYEDTIAQKEQTESIVRSMAEGLVVVNQKGDVVFLNPAAEKILGVSKTNKLGKSISDGLKDEQLLSLVKGNSNSKELEIELNAVQDQTKRVVRSSNAVIEDESGKTVGMVSVLTDITKQKELDRLKSEFVSGVTHELRTPIVAMKHSLDVVLEQAAGEVSQQQKEFLLIANRNLDRLSHMINDLLDLAKLEAHKLELKLQLASIGDVIEKACQTLEAWSKSKSIRLSYDVPPGLPQATMDPSRVEQVLSNLIGNSLKFTPANGSVKVTAKLRGNEKEVEVNVQDTGIGIAKEDLPKLFKKFQQVGARMAGGVNGTGLGLAISKEIVELHGGNIWVESEKGQGARFCFTIPLIPTKNRQGEA